MKRGIRGIVWAYLMEDGNAQLQRIVNDYKRLNINPARQRISQQESWIIFDNGDYWKVRRATDSSRGHRANISYIDHRIEQEWINNIIKPQTILPPYQAYNYY